MKDSIKRFIICLSIFALSIVTAFGIDNIIDQNERREYSLGEEESVHATISEYSQRYDIPESMIYTVMKMRSNCNRFYESGERYGYMGLCMEDVELIRDLYEAEITEDMLRNPSYNLLFGVQLINKLYSELGDGNAVYAALLYGEEKAAEWLSNSDYTDVTGSLTSVPESVGTEFYEYLKAESQYVKLYFN